MSSEMIKRKFRVWDKKSKVYWNIRDSWCITPDGEVAIVGSLPLTCDEAVLEQYSEKIDKNDKEICEGDILKIPRMWWHPGPIDNNEYELVVVKPPLGIFLFHRGDWSVEAEECEIIGNINENPELLK